MDILLKPSKYKGEVVIPSSKSELHRLLFLASMSKDCSYVKYYGSLCNDVLATIDSLGVLGNRFEISSNHIAIRPLRAFSRLVKVRESGTTFRFILPRIGYYAHEVAILREGRLAKRPIDDFLEELKKNGMYFKNDGDILIAGGKLNAGVFNLKGSVSSQYISALLLTLPFLNGDSVINIEGNIESMPYINMTMDTLALGGVNVIFENNKFYINGNSHISYTDYTAYGDYSSATFFASLGALSDCGINIRGLNTISNKQGDSRIFDILEQYGAIVEKKDDGFFVKKGLFKAIDVDVKDIPDMVMALCAISSCADGVSIIRNCQRLKFKESDRIETTINMLSSIGVRAEYKDGDMYVYPSNVFKNAIIDTCNDHRIAMASAIFSSITSKDVLIKNSKCVEKSYPDFFRDLDNLRIK